MTKKQLEKHLKDKTAKCPFCGYWDIVGDGVDIRVGETGQLAVQQVQCNSCCRSWVDEYQLVNAFEV